MSDSDLFDNVTLKTGEDAHEIRRRGFALTGPDGTGPCLLDVMLVDLPETGTIDRDTLGYGCRAPAAAAGMPAFGQTRAARNVERLYGPLDGSGGERAAWPAPLVVSITSAGRRQARFRRRHIKNPP
ncbi:MAG: hypothetical protein ACKON7_12940 [Planctomycetaceae bacterium]